MYTIELLNHTNDINTLMETPCNGTLFQADYHVLATVSKYDTLEKAISTLLKLDPPKDATYPACTKAFNVITTDDKRVCQIRLTYIDKIARLVICRDLREASKDQAIIYYAGNCDTIDKYMRGLNIIYSIKRLEPFKRKFTYPYLDNIIEQYVHAKSELCKCIVNRLSGDKQYAHGYLNTDEDTYYVRVDNVECPMAFDVKLERVTKVMSLRVTIQNSTSDVQNLNLDDELRSLWQQMNDLATKIQNTHISGEQLATCC